LALVRARGVVMRMVSSKELEDKISAMKRSSLGYTLLFFGIVFLFCILLLYVNYVLLPSGVFNKYKTLNLLTPILVTC